MKTLYKTAIASSMLVAASTATAEDVGHGFDVSMNVTLTTDYVWRGISQTQGEPAIQGGLDVSHESGFYVGTWASNVDFEGDASAELDFYAGYGMDITEDISWDIGYIMYTYTDASNDGADFDEVYTSVSGYGATVGVAYSTDTPTPTDNGSMSSEAATYWFVGYETDLPFWGLGLSLRSGGYDFSGDSVLGNSVDYNEIFVGLGKTMWGVDWELSYTDTDLSSGDCRAFAGQASFCDANVILSVSKSM